MKERVTIEVDCEQVQELLAEIGADVLQVIAERDEARQLIIDYAAAIEAERANPEAHKGLFGNPADDAHDRLLEYGFKHRPQSADSQSTQD